MTEPLDISKADYIRTLSEPFAARGGVVEEAPLITREEARSWLVREGLFDEEDLMTVDDEGRATDIETAKGFAVDMGPRVRAFSSGRTMLLEKRKRPAMWKGWTGPTQAMADLEQAYSHLVVMEGAA